MGSNPRKRRIWVLLGVILAISLFPMAAQLLSVFSSKATPVVVCKLARHNSDTLFLLVHETTECLQLLELFQSDNLSKSKQIDSQRKGLRHLTIFSDSRVVVQFDLSDAEGGVIDIGRPDTDWLTRVCGPVESGKRIVSVFDSYFEGTPYTSLADVLKVDSEEIRLCTLKRIGLSGVSAKPIASVIEPLLRHSGVKTRLAAAMALLQIQGASKLAEDVFLSEFASSDSKRVVACLEAMVGGEVWQDRIVVGIRSARMHAKAEVRSAYLRAIGRMGSRAEAEVIYFSPLASDESEVVRANALCALESVLKEHKQVYDAISLGLRDPNYDVRLTALRCISRYPVWIRRALHSIQHIARTDTPTYASLRALQMLVDFDPENMENVRLLEQMVCDTGPNGFSAEASNELGRLGRHASLALPTLRKVAEDSVVDQFVRNAALGAIKRINMSLQ